MFYYKRCWFSRPQLMFRTIPLKATKLCLKVHLAAIAWIGPPRLATRTATASLDLSRSWMGTRSRGLAKTRER